MKKQNVILLIIAIALVACACADWGCCPKVQVKQHFNLKDYMGEWYEITRFRDTPFEQDMYCVRVNYELESKKSANFTSTSFGRRGSRRGDPVAVPYTGFLPESEESAKLKLRLASGRESNYWVLDTDYDNYAVVFSCREILKVYHRIYVWILSRKPTIKEETRVRIIDSLKEYKIPVDRFINTVQDGCSKDEVETGGEIIKEPIDMKFSTGADQQADEL